MTVRSRVNLLGVEVTSWNVDGLVEAMITSANGSATRERLTTVHYANVHVLNVAYTNPGLRDQLRRASTVYCDGSGVQLGAWFLGQRLTKRLTAADWVDVLCKRAAQEGTALYFVGGKDGVSMNAAGILMNRHPGLRVVGTHHGFLNDRLSEDLVFDMNRSGAGIAIVGMGTPAQELWIAKYRQLLKTPVVWSVGALFDFVTGVQPRAPVWMRDSGLEWLWRWKTDPARLSFRYLIGNPLFVFRLLRQRLTGHSRTG